MEVIPAIDILDGRCVRLYQGDYERSERFDEDPLEAAKRWCDRGAKCLHVVDLDGAREGSPRNLKLIEAIARALPVRVQVGGGMRNRDRVTQVLATGVSRVILGTLAVEQPQVVAALCAEFPDQILVGIDARNGMVATRGWLNTSEVTALDLARRVAGIGIAGIVYTDIQRDGTLSGPNLETLRQMAIETGLPTIASGGIGSLTDLLSLLALEPLGVVGAILGKALYAGHIDLREALRAVGEGRYQDVSMGGAIA
ncbi:MAG: 1-(5-phosphoribosyl)-5-[(5-phosphoribosylamino)methylideneamino]imidazole-4-carboxamide isomerase [Oscillatoriales cyanobacterium SM2_1_8]|nr:1-(5-phosphoribosyl)-5-[(5-phosphoribosylamino)methylideneamino]imidazole-4-carboxamide isomerase [Oscillatoriales cyanobacterium SM2_1_8]